MVDFQRVIEYIFRTKSQDQYYDYRSSKHFLKKMGRARPVREDGHQAQAAKLAHTKYCAQDAQNVDVRLQKKREQALKLVEHITRQKKELLEQEEEFQNMFKEFNMQIIQNRQKRERAFIRMLEHKTYSEIRQEDINEIMEKVVKMRDYRRKLIEQLKKHLIYEEYIDTTLHDFGKQATIFDIIRRYTSLNSKKRYLTKRNLEANERLKILRQESMNFVKNQYLVTLQMRKRLSQSQVEYEAAMRRTSELEALISNIWDKCNTKLEDIIMAIEGIKNLNEMMLRRKMEQSISFRSMDKVMEFRKFPQVIRQLVDIMNTLTAVVIVMKKVEVRMRVIQKLWQKHRMFIKSPIL